MTEETGDKVDYTPLAEIDACIDLCNKYYYDKQLTLSQERSPRKSDLKARSRQLKKLYYAIKDNTDELVQALYTDFHRSKQESITLEVAQLCNNILHMIESLPKWMEPSKVKDRAPPFLFSKTAVERIARGSVLVIGPFNFPLMSSLGPAAAALAAGNTVVVKPSELTPATASCIERIINEANFPNGLIQIVKGSKPESQRLVESGKFDMIFFTGSTAVGSAIAQEAAKTVTPCVLELGGKSPVFITQNLATKNLRTALKRIFYSAFGNSGQICISPDYALVHESIYSLVVKEAKSVLAELFPEVNPATEYTHMVDHNAYNKVSKNLANTNGEKFTVGKQISDEDELLIPPTLVFDVDWNDALMKAENFGPVLPFVKYSDLDRTLDLVISNHDTPLVQYIFSQKEAEIQHILYRLRSGDCIVGDTLLHVGLTDAPFGGIGTSGYGNFGGIWGFNTFSHQRIVMKQPYWQDSLLSMRYPPFSSWKTDSFKFFMEQKPWFDRDGNDRISLAKWFGVSLVVALAVMLPNFFSTSWTQCN